MVPSIIEYEDQLKYLERNLQNVQDAVGEVHTKNLYIESKEKNKVYEHRRSCVKHRQE